MRKLIFSLVIACAAGTAHAQIKCWNDAHGKRVCGDAPPPGARVTTLKAPTSPEPAPASAGKDAAKGPLTPAQKEQEYRKRQQEEQKAAAKAADEQKAASDKKDNCARAQESARSLEAGGRVARTDSKGERYFLDDKQIADELGKARQLVQQWCN